MKNVSTTEERLLNALQGTRNDMRLSRESAAAICGGDRQARETIHQLRLKGYVICSDSRIGGYYFADTPADAKKFLAETDSRIKELMAMKEAVIDGVLS